MPVITDAEMDALDGHIETLGNSNNGANVDLAVHLRQLLIGVRGREVRTAQMRVDTARYLPYDLPNNYFEAGVRARVIFYLSGDKDVYESAAEAYKSLRTNQLVEAVMKTADDAGDTLTWAAAKTIVEHLAKEFDAEF